MDLGQVAVQNFEKTVENASGELKSLVDRLHRSTGEIGGRLKPLISVFGKEAVKSALREKGVPDWLVRPLLMTDDKKRASPLMRTDGRGRSGRNKSDFYKEVESVLFDESVSLPREFTINDIAVKMGVAKSDYQRMSRIFRYLALKGLLKLVSRRSVLNGERGSPYNVYSLPDNSRVGLYDAASEVPMVTG